MSDPEVEEFTTFKVGGKPHEPTVVTLVVNAWAAGTNGSGHRCSSVCNLNHDSGKPLSLNSIVTILTTYTDDPMPSFGEKDGSGGELWGTECKAVSVCGRRARSKPNGRDWIKQISLDWKRVRMVSHTSKTESLY